MMRLYAILTKEFRQILRDPFSLGMLIAVPALLLILYGYALSFDVKHVRMAVLDEDCTPQSRAMLDSLFQNPYFDRAGTLARRAEADEWLRRGKARAVLIIPRGHAAALARGETAPVQALVDGSDSTGAGVVIGYLDALADRLNRAAHGAARIAPDPAIQTEPRVWFNPELESAHFLVPGLIGMLYDTFGRDRHFALDSAREGARDHRTDKRFAGAAGGTDHRQDHPLHSHMRPDHGNCPAAGAAPVRSGYTRLVRAALAGHPAVPLRGPWHGPPDFVGHRSQQEAFQIATLSTLIRAMTLSGLIFPISSMPAPIQAITLLVLPRHFTEALRAIILKNAPLAAIWPSLLALLVLGIIFNLVAARNMARSR